ncbi:transporter substrate-binding domain-containing protein [Lampropedia aestuarii]|uniref:transporter substrate-binding domain-containing protein n=1 Tax=Lampropedia aestuarii TaxID=2562762 RepID=UPI0024698EE7|nr:transporter substrate-binding domain-containing protein [Lampropedia aestuarii]MDH5856598.1 transporter substrate-binding domain-containing protein [Lampropedia aestuarii]
MQSSWKKYHRVAVGALLACAAFSAAAADLLSEVRKRGELVVATEAAFKPFEFVENGKIVGYNKDLLTFVMQDFPEVKLKQQDVPWSGVLPGLAASRFDLVVTAVAITPERERRFAFTLPVADATVALLRRTNDATLTQPSDINGRVIGSQVGTSLLAAVTQYNQELKKAGQPGAKEIKQYATMDEAYADLAAGRIDAVAQSRSNLANVVKERPDVYSIVDQTIGPKAYYAWVGRKDEASAPLIAAVSKRLAEANTSGLMKELQLKWFGFEMPVPTEVPSTAN